MDGLARVLETARKRREDGSVADLANCTTGLDGLQVTMGSDSRCGIWWGGRVDSWSAMWIAGPLVRWLDSCAAGCVAGALRLLVGSWSAASVGWTVTGIAGALHHVDCWSATPQDFSPLWDCWSVAVVVFCCRGLLGRYTTGLLDR